MLHRHFRRFTTLLALLGIVTIAPFSHAESKLSGANGSDRGYAMKLKRLQVRLLQEKLEGRKERKARAWRLMKQGKNGMRVGYAGKAPRDRSEPGGPQGVGTARSARLATPTSLSSLLPNVKVNNSAGDAADAGQSEASIAAWNQYVLVAWNDGQGFVTGPDLMGYGYSTNGGTTFTDGGDPPRRTTVAVNEKTGEFYLCGLIDTSGTVNGVAVVKATFSGTSITWGAPRLVRGTSNATGFIDKPWITVDSLTGNVYVTYTFFGAGGDTIDFQRSTNGGSTWSAPIKLSANADAGRVQGSRPAVGPNGEVYVTWYAIGTDATFLDYFRIRKSTDNGVSFGAQSTAAGMFSNFPSGAPGFNREFAITYPSIAVDRTRGRTHSGRVYIAWNEGINFYDDDLGSVIPSNEVEANNTSGTATPAAIGQSLVGSVSSTSDLDYWSFPGIAGQTVIVYADSVAPGLDMSLRLFCADGTTRLAFSAPGVGLNNLYVFTLPATGTYYIRTASFGGTGYYSLATGLNVPGPERARDHRDVFSSYSDGGASWSTPVRISDSPAGFDDWLPELTVSSHGRPYGFWYDWRDAPSGNCGGISHVYMSRSDDDGLTWSSLGPISDVQTNWTTTASNIAPNQGDYLHVFANATAVYPVWADGRGGTADVYSVALPLALTPTQATLASAVAEVDRVSITWYSGGARDFIATVERREEIGDWVQLGNVTPDGTGRMVYEDRAVTPGSRYAYRIAVPQDGGTYRTVEAWVQVPLAASFSLYGARPNPAARNLVVSFALPKAEPATLALFDLNGRSLRSVTITAAGSQLYNLGEGLTLDPGIYLVRLTQGGRTLTSRVSVVR
jgi:hypothetical protein